MANIDMSKRWDTPADFEKVEMILSVAIGNMNTAEAASPEMEQAYESLAKMCERYINEHNKHVTGTKEEDED